MSGTLRYHANVILTDIFSQFVIFVFQLMKINYNSNIFTAFRSFCTVV